MLQGIKDKVGSRINVAYSEGCKITRDGDDWVADTAQLSNPVEDRKLIAEAVQVAKTSDVALLVLGGNEDTKRRAGPTRISATATVSIFSGGKTIS